MPQAVRYTRSGLPLAMKTESECQIKEQLICAKCKGRPNSLGVLLTAQASDISVSIDVSVALQIGLSNQSEVALVAALHLSGVRCWHFSDMRRCPV